MTIELAPLISVVSVCFAIYFGVINNKRNQKTEDKNDATQLTMVIVKLENIGIGVSEIKGEISNLKNDLKEDRERIVKVEAAVEVIQEQLKACEKYCGRFNNIKGGN